MNTLIEKSTTRPKGYNDLYFRVAMSVIAAHILVLYYDEEPFLKAFYSISYWRGLIGSFIISMILTAYIHYVTVRLDGKFDWHKQTTQRFLWQCISGFVAPALLAFLLASLYFWLNGVHILDTVYLSQDFTLIIFMLLAINLYYWGLHSFLRHHEVMAVHQVTPVANSNEHIPRAQKRVEAFKEAVPAKEFLVIDTLNRLIPVKMETICYCYLLQGFVFVRTREMESLNESHQISGTMKTIEAELDKRMFFRINRRMIVNFYACDYFKPGKNKTLELALNPAPYPNEGKVPAEHLRLCVVSEDRATAFKQWMDR